MEQYEYNEIYQVPKHKRTKQIINKIIKKNGMQLKYVSISEPYKLYLNAVKNAGLALQYVPFEERTEELCMHACLNNGNALQYVPHKYKTEDIKVSAVLNCIDALEFCYGDNDKNIVGDSNFWSAILKKDGTALRAMKYESWKTYNLCLIACINSATALQYSPYKTSEFYFDLCFYCGSRLKSIPRKDITVKMCLAAINNQPNSFAFVPKEFITKELCFAYVNNDDVYWKWIPNEFITEELYLHAARHNGYYIRDVPDEFITPELCLHVVQNCGRYIKDIPIEFITPELCLHAILQQGDSIIYIPEEFKTFDLCMHVVKTGNNLEFIPEDIINSEICMHAIENGLTKFNFIPNKLLTDEIKLLMYKNYNGPFAEFPFITYTICMQACKENPMSINVIPEKFIDDNLLLLLIGGTWRGLCDDMHVPEKFVIPLCFAACRQNGLALYYVPKKLQSQALCAVACANNGLALQYVPSPLKSHAICTIAIKNDARAKKYLPKHEKIDNNAVAVADPVITPTPSSNIMPTPSPDIMPNIKNIISCEISINVSVVCIDCCENDYLSDINSISSSISDNIKENPCRNMRLCFTDGQKIRHSAGLSILGIPKIWIGIYNAKKNVITYDGRIYKSMSSFSSDHYTKERPDRSNSSNGWAECEYEKNGTWLSCFDITIM